MSEKRNKLVHVPEAVCFLHTCSRTRTRPVYVEYGLTLTAAWAGILNDAVRTLFVLGA